MINTHVVIKNKNIKSWSWHAGIDLFRIMKNFILPVCNMHINYDMKVLK